MWHKNEAKRNSVHVIYSLSKRELIDIKFNWNVHYFFSQISLNEPVTRDAFLGTWRYFHFACQDLLFENFSHILTETVWITAEVLIFVVSKISFTISFFYALFHQLPCAEQRNVATFRSLDCDWPTRRSITALFRHVAQWLISQKTRTVVEKWRLVSCNLVQGIPMCIFVNCQLVQPFACITYESSSKCKRILTRRVYSGYIVTHFLAS